LLTVLLAIPSQFAAIHRLHKEKPAMSNTRLNRWGHSVGLRLPKSVLEAAGLTAHSAISIRLLDSGEIRLRPIGKVVPAESNDTDAATARTAAEKESEWEQW
jgi:antitoxin MazE